MFMLNKISESESESILQNKVDTHTIDIHSKFDFTLNNLM